MKGQIRITTYSKIRHLGYRAVVSLISLSLLIFGAAFSCTGDTVDPECSEEEEYKSIPFEPISPSSLAFKDRDVPYQHRDKIEVNLIIKSEKDFNKHLTLMNDFPAIDFSNYALLCGRKTYMNCIRLDSGASHV
jgi:hypothetical protein